MPRSGQRAKLTAKQSRARERKQPAVRETNKPPQDDAPEASNARRSARIRAKTPAPHPKEKGQLNPRRSQQQAEEPKPLTHSRPGTAIVLDLVEDTTPAKPLVKKGKATATESRESRQVSRDSKPKTVSKFKRNTAAKGNEQPEQDLTPQVQPPRKGVEKGKAQRSGSAARKPTRKTARKKTKSSEPALVSSKVVPDDESRRHVPHKEFEFLEYHQALSREALEEHTLNLGSVGAARNDESTYTSGTIFTDPREQFNYNYGYLPPLDEEASHIIAVVMENPASAKKMARISPDLKALFKKGLELRNVEIDPSESIDPRHEAILSSSLGGFGRETAEQKAFCEQLWLHDKAKLSPDSSEAIFQRTLMVSLIARHFLIYEKEINGEQLLDFSAEELWTCLPMPSRALWDIEPGSVVNGKLLTQPKPDLAVCFKRKAVIEHGLWRSLPEATQELACFENQNSGTSRIFHFLTVEAKNATTSLEDPKALYQSLNNASQALNNFYEFFQDAGPTHRQIFFDKIRFFSVVANTQGILIRIHRAIEIPPEAQQLELVMPNRPEYRLNFEYREFARLTGEDRFTREGVIEVFAKMLKYAVEELSVWISAAAKALLENLEKNWSGYQARRKVSFYRHGQPSPQSPKNTPGPSIATSKSGRASPLAEQLLNSRLVSFTTSFAEESTNGQITPKANFSQPNSQLSNGSKKRRVKQAQIDSTDNEESQVKTRRLRKGKQRS